MKRRITTYKPVKARHFRVSRRKPTAAAAAAEPVSGPVSDSAYNRDVAPFKASFDDFSNAVGRSLPDWTNKIKHASAGERAALLLRTMRGVAGLSQATLGDKAGIAQAEVSALENSKAVQGPTYDVIARVADACGFYITFSAKTASPKKKEWAASHELMAHRYRPRGLHPIKTYFISSEGEPKLVELDEHTTTSTLVFDDEIGHAFKVSIESLRNAAAALAEVETEAKLYQTEEEIEEATQEFTSAER